MLFSNKVQQKHALVISVPIYSCDSFMIMLAIYFDPAKFWLSHSLF